MAQQTRPRFTGRRGSILVAALAVSMVASLLAVTLLSIAVNSLQLAHHRCNGEMAFELAEAALHQGVLQLAQNPHYAGEGPTSWGGGQILTQISQPPGPANYRALVGVGRVTAPDGAVFERRVEAMVNIAAPSPIWGYAIITQDPQTYSGNITVDSAPTPNQGDLHSNASVTISGNVSVQGRVTAVSSVTVNGNPTIMGGAQGGVPPVPFPPLDTTALQAQAAANGITNGNVSLSGNSTGTLQGEVVGNLSVSGNASLVVSGVVWVTGTVNLSGNRLAGDGVLVSAGAMSISGNSGLTGSETNNLALVSLSNSGAALSISGNAKMRGGLYVPNGQISISGTARLWGTVAAKSVTMSGNVHVTGNRAFQPPTALNNTVKVLSWQEL